MNPMQIFLAPLLVAAMFQAPAKPPVKMGLWESNGTTKMQMPDGTEKTTSSILRSCYTPTSWLKLMGPTAKEACPKINEVWSASDYSFDVQCSAKPKMAEVKVHFDSLEKDHGSMDFYAMPDGTPMKLHGDFESHWVSADCGDVSPDHPVLVR